MLTLSKCFLCDAYEIISMIYWHTVERYDVVYVVDGVDGNIFWWWNANETDDIFGYYDSIWNTWSVLWHCQLFWCCLTVSGNRNISLSGTEVSGSPQKFRNIDQRERPSPRSDDVLRGWIDWIASISQMVYCRMLRFCFVMNANWSANCYNCSTEICSHCHRLRAIMSEKKIKKEMLNHNVTFNRKTVNFEELTHFCKFYWQWDIHLHSEFLMNYVDNIWSISRFQYVDH